MYGKLYVVATPIGNLKDISFRAVEVLKSVNHIFCEDTRTTKRLLDEYNISTQVSSYTSWSGFGKINKALLMIKEGKDIAIVSDAGTPSISDPGVKLIKAVRDQFGGNSLRSIPGACASVSALASSGAPASSFVFLGFLPKKKGRTSIFKYISQEKKTVVIYESPHRLEKTLLSLSEVLDPKREVIVAREITKIYESYVNGTIEEVVNYFNNNKDKIKGEIVIIISSLSKQ